LTATVTVLRSFRRWSLFRHWWFLSFLPWTFTASWSPTRSRGRPKDLKRLKPWRTSWTLGFVDRGTASRLCDEGRQFLSTAVLSLFRENLERR